MKPTVTFTEYMKFGFVRTKTQIFLCPECGGILNAGWNYQPKHCEECGTALDFTGIVYEPDEELEIDHEAAQEYSDWFWSHYGKGA